MVCEPNNSPRAHFSNLIPTQRFYHVDLFFTGHEKLLLLTFLDNLHADRIFNLLQKSEEPASGYPAFPNRDSHPFQHYCDLLPVLHPKYNNRVAGRRYFFKIGKA